MDQGRGVRGSIPKGQRMMLHRALSKLGFCSRAEGFFAVREGRVSVNGRFVRDPFLWVELGTDRIAVSGILREGRPPARCFLMHKPRGITVTRSDERGRGTVYDLLRSGLFSGREAGEMG